MSWIAEKKKIQSRIDNGKPQPSEPETLELKEIELADQVFQHRMVSQWDSEKHIKELGKSLKNSEGKPFTPMTVFWCGDAWVLIDGHHRYQAYQEAKYTKPVPVEVYKGSLDQALGQAAAGNTQDKLPMTSAEKSNAAWRLVIGARQLSINKTKDITRLSRQTVIFMRKVRDTLLEKHGEDGLAEMDWINARLTFQGLDRKDHDYDDAWMRKEAEALAATLIKKHGRELAKNIEVLWMALDLYDSRITGHFLELHGISPETGDRDEEDVEVPF